MTHDELLALLARARVVLERHLFEEDGAAVRDDVAQVCMAIDDVLPAEERVPPMRIGLEPLERSAA
jgi:hypothetical protein